MIPKDYGLLRENRVGNQVDSQVIIVFLEEHKLIHVNVFSVACVSTIQILGDKC